jgi:hypothetical protein
MSIAVGEVISGDKRGIATFQQEEEEEEEAGLICKDAGLRRWSRLGCDRAAAELLFRSVFAMIRFVNTTTDWEGRGGGCLYRMLSEVWPLAGGYGHVVYTLGNPFCRRKRSKGLIALQSLYGSAFI